MDGRLPLPTLLSRALVAFVIEFDNEFEHQAPHRTTDFGGTPRAPWLVSMVMWSRYLRHIPEDGISVKELQLRSGWDKKELQNWLTRLSAWWRYLAIETPVACPSSKQLGPQSLVLPTPGGQKALAVWKPLTETIESRWRARFGTEAIDLLMARLSAVAGQLDPGLPNSLPILGYGLFSSDSKPQRVEKRRPQPKNSPELKTDTKPTLPGLLAKVLLAFAIEFETGSPVSLAIAANVLRLADEAGVPVRDLPRLSGVSEESLQMAFGFLKSRGLAVVQAESPAKKVKVLKLTPAGQLARTQSLKKIQAIEESWRNRFENGSIARLRGSLEAIAADAGPNSLLMTGIKPYPDGWRAQVPAKECLPDFPMTLHRGGFPDGS